MKIPQRLRELLAQSPYEAATLDVARAVGTLVGDNEMPFFPAYTDHGLGHVQRVLDAAVQLVSPKIWKKRLLGGADAAVLICAVLLHDIALHIREPGFVRLVSDRSPYEPLHWWSEPQSGRQADRPWPELWQEFRKEARHFDRSQLNSLLGPNHDGVPAVAFAEVDRQPEQWVSADRLLIGEFLRRHHARLAHEIAHRGFPGLEQPDSDFPVLAQNTSILAEAAGVVARSHNESLRVTLRCLEDTYKTTLEPAGAHLPYLMGLLRIADYLQLDGTRAPRMLMHLKAPQSRQSLDEWRKHGAIAWISWRNQDPNAISIHVSPGHGLRTHLQLTELFDQLQHELDTTTAVLSETYAASELALLRLSRQRIWTNLSDAALHARMGYWPQRAALRSSDGLFRLMINDLYGNEPAVAGRELVQNAVDAVRERRRWEDQSDRQLGAGELRELPAEIVVEVQQIDDVHGQLRVVDRGIGMSPSTVVDYFLTAGSSLEPPRDADGAVEREHAVRWMKAGRFGIGGFAAFMLGNTVHVTTKHVDAQRAVSFVVEVGGDLVQLNWADAPIGTEVVVPFRLERLPSSSGDSAPGKRVRDWLGQIAAFAALADPTVHFRALDPDGAVTEEYGCRGQVPLPNADLPHT